jgi:DNA-binding response OmpR family regulator
MEEKEYVNNAKRALIIDDEVELCMMIRNFFKKKNKHAEYSTSLKEGLQKFEEHQPDILILDHNLPDGQGIGYIRTFKDKIRNKSLYIVVMSAMSNLRLAAIENGADDFIDKPITFHKLNEILQRKN